MIKIFEIDNNGDDQYNFLWSNVNLFAYFKVIKIINYI